MNGESLSGGEAGVTDLMIKHLHGTKPWVRLLSIVGFVCAALACGSAVLYVASYARQSDMGFVAGGIGAIVAGTLGACLYLFPSLRLFQYASAIAALDLSRTSLSMEAALLQQMKFWRLLGIEFLIVLCLYAITLAFGILATFLAGFSTLHYS